MGRGGRVVAARPLHIGEYPGEPVGSTYVSRREAMERHVHTQWGRGIDARAGEPGAGAICPSGGYVDDIDHGDWILYTGQGGRDVATGRQIAHQSLEAKDNAGLVSSHEQNWPVRVLRGNGADIYAPAVGYRYDGLYWVDDYWVEPGDDGFRVCRFLMVQLTPEEALRWVDMTDYPGRELPRIMSWRGLNEDRRQPPPGRGTHIQRLTWPASTTPAEVVPPPSLPETFSDADLPTLPEAALLLPEGTETPDSVLTLTYRKQRDSRVSAAVKAMYQHRCQICAIRIELAAGPYSEGAHVRPLGAPHHGADTVSNMLCLCPNHHVMFDGGGLYISDNYFVYERDGSPVGALSVQTETHLLNPANLAYHRRIHGIDA